MKRIFLVVMLCLVGLVVVGCSWVNKADFYGYVKDKATTAGIVGATVKLYLTDPGSDASATPFAETTTAYNSSIPGYFSYKLIWSNTAPAYQDQGDLATVWVKVTHPDFADSAVVKVAGVVSSAQNTAPDILLNRTGFSALVSGTVMTLVSSTLTGVNGVKVGLQLDSSASSEIDDYVSATTGVTSSGVTTQGVFAFSVPIKWTNATAPSGSDVKSVKIWLSWPAITVPTSLVAGNKSITVNILSGSSVNAIDPFIIP